MIRFKHIYRILFLALLLLTLWRGHQLRHRTQQASLPEVRLPEGINHLLDNSFSELDETRRLEKTVERFMDQWEITGASLAVMKDGKLLYSKGFGYADREKGIRMDVRHIFRIASLSKLITATGIMKLCEEGRLSLDAKVFGEEGILCDTAFLHIRDPKIRKITVEHLLRHQGGFSVRNGDPLFNTLNIARQMRKRPPLTADDLVEYASRSRIRYEPGSSNIYSNLGYVILGKVIEKVSGQSYEHYIQDSILFPIGCYDMHIGHTQAELRFPNEVRYYEPADAEPTECYDGSGRITPKSYGSCDLQVLGSAGGWIASPVELMKFITAIDPEDSRPDILRPETIAYMTEKDKRQFPIGWMRTTEHDDWSRTGSLAGSSAMLQRRHDGYTWVLITNTSSWSGSRFPNKIAAMMRDALRKVGSWPERDLFVTAEALDSSGVSTAAVRPQQKTGEQADSLL